VAHPARGTLTGNRGILHDDRGQLGPARWRHKHWIACALAFKGWRRPIMSPGTWTELFFLDEAVAFAAGHRPCALCRRDDYRLFRQSWERAFGAPARAAEIDQTLHAARIVPGTRRQCRHEAPLAALPEGCMVVHADAIHLVRAGALHPFAPEGYGPPLPRPEAAAVTLLTPAPIVAVLAAGYRPALHPSAGA
jgi:hypothetical protein